MRRALALITAMVLFGLIAVPAFASGSQGGGHDPVTICHRTNSETNPYVVITVDDDAVDGKGGADHFGRHTGPVFEPGLKDQGIKWGDIIPPKTDNGKDLPHDGLNWTEEGRAIYDNGCKPVDDTPTTTIPPRSDAYCPVSGENVVIFDEIYSPGTKPPSSSTKNFAGEAGTYQITAYSFDDAHPYADTQKYEQWHLVINGSIVGTTNDLDDNLVIESYNLGQHKLEAFTQVTAQHVTEQDGTRNSVQGCVLFEKIEEPTTTTTVPETTTTTAPEPTTTTVPEPEPEPEPEPITATAGGSCELIFAETTGPATVYLSYIAEGRSKVTATEIISAAGGSSVELVVREADLNRDLVWDVLIETVDGQTITASGEEECSEPTPTTTPTTAPPTTAPPSTLPRTGLSHEGAATAALIALLSGAGLLFLTRKSQEA